MRTAEDLGLHPEFHNLVWVKLEGRILSDEAQDQRDQLAEWFLRSDVGEEDMDSVYVDADCGLSTWKAHATHMVFGFRDPNKAILFKLAWG